MVRRSYFPALVPRPQPAGAPRKRAAAIDANPNEPRFQVQYVIRPQTEELPDYRGYAGRIQSGTYRPGDRVRIWPSGLETVIEAIEVNQREVATASAPQGVICACATMWT